MSTNTLIAFVVGLMFLLCVIIVLSCFADRRLRTKYKYRRPQPQTQHPADEDTLIQQKPWPTEGGQ